MNTPPVLPQWHSGVRFRSSLEARWAIFFDAAGIRWEYEPEGFIVGGRPYRPDFLLDCGTWVEVKGDPRRLNLALMRDAAMELPGRHETWTEEWLAGYGVTPKLLILSSIPAPADLLGDAGWIGLEHYPGWGSVRVGYFGFGGYSRVHRPSDLETLYPEDFEQLFTDMLDLYMDGNEAYARKREGEINELFRSLENYGNAEFFLKPQFFPGQPAPLVAYAAARAHRFGRQ